MIMAYHILKDKVPYKELGNDYLIQRREKQIVKSHVRMLNKLGYSVEIKPACSLGGEEALPEAAIA